MEQEEACSSSLRQCRICHDEEDERRSAMESPCACSGSLKYAHRGCVQRWCDEKGSAVCEICLQVCFRRARVDRAQQQFSDSFACYSPAVVAHCFIHATSPLVLDGGNFDPGDEG
ncbi:PIT1 [Zea mays]|uniref:PIT1 n=1 Tax=Zea mays TaxID=4577 RepID=A0A1D6MRS0_MAIZE|nr:PIT1 [Zea mays]